MICSHIRKLKRKNTTKIANKLDKWQHQPIRRGVP